MKRMPTERVGPRLVMGLGRYKERWNPKNQSELARHLREFADELEKQQGGG